MQINLKDGLPPLEQLTQSIRETQLVALSIPADMLAAALIAIPKLAAFSDILPFTWAKGIGYWLKLLTDFIDDLTPEPADLEVLLRFPTVGTKPDPDHKPEVVDLVTCTMSVAYKR